MKLKTPYNPQAKTDGLVIQELAEEILIYDLEKDKVYDLNLTSALVWQNCDGNKSITDIAQAIEKKLNQKVPDELVWLTLETLKKEDLVQYEKDNFAQFSGINRRELLKRVGFASLVALPVVSSLVAPSAILATSHGAPAPVCFTCVTGIGVASGPCGAINCPGLTCQCFGNNSCNGVGQPAAITNTCEDCRTVGMSTSNNAFQCMA